MYILKPMVNVNVFFSQAYKGFLSIKIQVFLLRVGLGNN